MKRTSISLVLVLLVLSPSFAQNSKIRPVKVYVFTAEAKVADDAFKDRVASVKDIEKALQTKDKEVALVKSAAAAELTLEVVRRGYVPFGSTMGHKPPAPGSQGGGSVPTLLVKLTAGDDSRDVIGGSPTSVAIGWDRAAEDVADRVAEYVRKDGAKIPRK